MNECKIVEDLLPLYAEDLVSPETKAYVENHCAGCECCEKLRTRTQQNLDIPQNNVNYKKDLKKSVWWIIGKTMLVSALGVALFIYCLWEWGFLNKQIYISPDGNTRFEVVDCDAGLFEGGACIVTPEGRDRNLYGNKSYQSFNVWFSPDSNAYFAWIEFDDHDETYLMVREYDAELELEVSRYYPSYEIEERDFLALFRESELGTKYLTEDAIIEFDRWSEAGRFRGRYIYFNYEVPGRWFGEIVYDVVEHKIKTITCDYTREYYLNERYRTSE